MKLIRLFAYLTTTILLMFHLRIEAEELSEHTLRAAYLYNFALLTETPSLPHGSVEYCFYHANQFDAAIDLLTKKTINDLPIRIRYIGKPEEALTCNILVIGTIERYESKLLINQISNLPILTIADSAPYYLKPNVVINLVSESDHIGFEINLGVSKQAKLTLSTRLLKVAKTVYQ